MRLVVIGGVAAGMSAAARARRLDPALEITVLEMGETVSYGACGLPYFIEGRVPDWRSLIVYTAEQFREQRNIDVRTRAEVTGVSHARRSVRLRSGEEIRYDKLVLATGARQDRTAIAGLDQPHVFSMNTIPEAMLLREYLRTARPDHAIVIGASYLGVEAVEALRAHGWRVSVVHGGKHLLKRDDAFLTDLLTRHLSRFHVEVRPGVCVRTIEPDSVAGVHASLVVLAAGLKPNTALAEEAGVELGSTGAVRTNERMETNLASVYAAGDCAESIHLITGRPSWIPLGTTANKMGRVAGANAAGRRARFAGVVDTSIVRVCGLGVGLTGLSETRARREGFHPVVTRIEGLDRARYFRGRPTTVELVADRSSGRLLGGAVLGDTGVEGRINVIATAITRRMDVEEFGQLDLAYAPPFAPVWDPLLIAAQQLIKLLGSSV